MQLNSRIFTALAFGIAGYIVIVSFFGLLYYSTESLSLYGQAGVNQFSYFDCWYFSMITFSTIGYGEIVPFGNMGKILVFLESCIGLAFIPTLGGYLAYLFIQCPKDYYLSENIYIRHINDKIFLSARIGNKGKPIVDCDASLEMFLIENNLKRTILKHVFSKPLVEISWYLNLRLDDEENFSVLENLKKVIANPENCAIRITFKGHDSRSGNMIHLFKVYKVNDIHKGGKFLDIYTWNGLNRKVVSWHNFNKTEPLEVAKNAEIDRLLQ